MLTKKRILGSAVACAGVLAAFTFAASPVSADEARLTVTPAVYRAADGDDHGATIQLVRHGWGGGYRGYGYGGYRGYGWGGYGYRPRVRPYYGYGYPGIGYGVGYGYPAYGYGYPAYGYGYPAYGGVGVGVGVW
jgi:hypothetical protein